MKSDIEPLVIKPMGKVDGTIIRKDAPIPILPFIFLLILWAFILFVIL